ncbi:hypothetical protein [Streptomyces sp. NPDC006551]|uniref:hypothetical protein n=1 Tax=Streptomyces sp. NPDC006551 TaxID=3157178 RepID=UPI0033B6768E
MPDRRHLTTYSLVPPDSAGRTHSIRARLRRQCDGRPYTEGPIDGAELAQELGGQWNYLTSCGPDATALVHADTPHAAAYLHGRQLGYTDRGWLR